MKLPITLSTCVAALAAATVCTVAGAADRPGKALTPEQAHYRDCRIQAAEKARDDRMPFMKQCLTGKAPSEVDVSGLAATGPKARACRAQAAGKPRDDRLAFMKQCMGDAPPSDVQTSPVAADDAKARACHEQVGTVARDDRIAFMKKCLAE